MEMTIIYHKITRKVKEKYPLVQLVYRARNGSQLFNASSLRNSIHFLHTSVRLRTRTRDAHTSTIYFHGIKQIIQ